MNANTLFLRLEGPMQAWGLQDSKFVVRRTAEAPTKSGVIGMLCAALGVSRAEAPDVWLSRLAAMRMGVRVDMPGVHWWDYHTVGAGMEMRIAEGEGRTKPGALLTRREYLCDASFLVVLQGEPALVQALCEALRKPQWTVYLGRKSCPPARPLLDTPPGEFADVVDALGFVPWRQRLKGDDIPETLRCLIEWRPGVSGSVAPPDAQVFYDVPVSLDPPAHEPRFVIRQELRVGAGGVVVMPAAGTGRAAPPAYPRANYRHTEYRNRRAERLVRDGHCCVFCRSPVEGANATVQHITYRRAGGDERLDDLRSLCRLCHDAVTMIEYGLGMGLDRINPEEPRWRDAIVRKRDEIVRFRSLAARRRRLQPEEV